MLKRITSINLQTHEHVVIDLPRTGLVRFRGDNSEGKSVIVKTLNEAIKCDLHLKRNRNPLIRYGYSNGQLMLEKYDGGETLLINVAREAANTYYELSRPGQEPLRRYLADKNLKELIWMFGFHYTEERDFSLNIYNTYDPLIFLTTSSRTNFDVLDSAITDPYVDASIAGIDSTLKELDEAFTQISEASRNCEARMAGLTVWDVQSQEARKSELEYLIRNIQALETPSLPDFVKVPDMTPIDLLDTASVRSSMDSIVLVKDEIDDILNKIDRCDIVVELGRKIASIDLSSDIHEVLEYTAALENEECPVCGRGYHLNESVQIAL